MSNNYSPKHFFRRVPNHLLKKYFKRQNVLSDLDFKKFNETKVEPIYQAWLTLSQDIRNKIEQDFQDINHMATESGSKAIIDEANYHGEDLATQFSAMKGFYEHAFWTFLEKPGYWRGAVAFDRADTIPQSYWRKRKNLPQKPANVGLKSIANLEQALSQYFHNTQGRGENCKVDCYKRQQFDYFFAYPEDYAQTRIEWEESEFKRPVRHPAFELIFVYSLEDGTLDIYITGDRKVVPDLQVIFAENILSTTLNDDKEDERIYDLNPLLSRDFAFCYAPDAGIIDVAINKLRLAIYGMDRKRLTLEADTKENKYALYDLLDCVAKGISLSQVKVTQVGLKVILRHPQSADKTRTRSFSITSPNSCTLKHDDASMVIRKMLVDSGIEPTVPAK